MKMISKIMIKSGYISEKGHWSGPFTVKYKES